MTRCLVVYYSWTGNTAKVAKAIAQNLSAELEEIREVKPRKGLFAYIRSAFESRRRRCAAILPPTHDPSDYDLVILGCPVWAQDMASPMRAYIEEQRPRLQRIALFCTLGGAGGDLTLAKMASLCERSPAAGLQIADPDMKSGAWVRLAEDFATRILRTAASGDVTAAA
jgi:flavodoxin